MPLAPSPTYSIKKAAPGGAAVVWRYYGEVQQGYSGILTTRTEQGE